MNIPYEGKPIWDVLRDIANRIENGEKQIENFAMLSFSNQPLDKSLFCTFGLHDQRPDQFALNFSWVLREKFMHKKVA